MSINPFRSQILNDIPNVQHGFFTRCGGVSTKNFESLNVKAHDDELNDNILENKKRILEALNKTQKSSLPQWVTLNQRHTKTVALVEHENLHEMTQGQCVADSAVTALSNVVLSIRTADCAPILFADMKIPLVGAAHAGWQGTFDGIIQNTIRLMKKKGATRIVAAVGPSIQQKVYEVGPEFYDYFYHKIPNSFSFADFFKRSSERPEKYLFDLPKLVCQLITHEGVNLVDHIAEDTYTQPHLFFSHRRSTHGTESVSGNQASCIMIMS